MFQQKAYYCGAIAYKTVFWYNKGDNEDIALYFIFLITNIISSLNMDQGYPTPGEICKYARRKHFCSQGVGSRGSFNHNATAQFPIPITE